MRRTQNETNSTQNRKIEQLIERKKSGEGQKKSVEHYLIFGIIAFCLTLLVVVITSNQSSDSSANKDKHGQPKQTENQLKDKARPQPVNR